MYSTIDPAKIGDVQAVAQDLERLPRELLIYIQGRTDQALADSERQATA